MASEDVQTNLRLPAELKDRLVASAAENNRSLSAEVASRLEASYGGAAPEKVLFALEMLASDVEIERSATYLAERRAYTLASALKSAVVRHGDLLPEIQKRPGPDVKNVEEIMDETLANFADSGGKAAAILKNERAKVDTRMKALGIPKP